MSKHIVGFAGQMGCGKSYAYNVLTKHSNSIVRLSFASTLKNMCIPFLKQFLDFEGDTEAVYTQEFKNTVIPDLGVTVRHVLQTIGTEWGRVFIHPDVWVKAAMRAAQRDEHDIVVFDDVRFDNEADAVRKAGGSIILIVRPDNPHFDHTKADHASERGISHELVDDIIYNTDGLDTFADRLETAFFNRGLIHSRKKHVP